MLELEEGAEWEGESDTSDSVWQINEEMSLPYTEEKIERRSVRWFTA
jgi:hypothetical protein